MTSPGGKQPGTYRNNRIKFQGGTNERTARTDDTEQVARRRITSPGVRRRHAPCAPATTATHHRSGSGFVNFEFVEPGRGDRIEHRVVVSIHRDGIPAVIAELQRLMGES